MHSAFDFLLTPTCCVWCAARLNLRMWSGYWRWVVCIAFNWLLNRSIILILISWVSFHTLQNCSISDFQNLSV